MLNQQMKNKRIEKTEKYFSFVFFFIIQTTVHFFFIPIDLCRPLICVRLYVCMLVYAHRRVYEKEKSCSLKKKRLSTIHSNSLLFLRSSSSSFIDHSYMRVFRFCSSLILYTSLYKPNKSDRHAMSSVRHCMCL